MDIKTYLSTEKATNLPIVAEFLDLMEKRYQSLSFEHAKLLEALKIHLVRGGKWHRPALGLLAYRMAGGTEENVIRPSLAALELLHRYILIHDDIIDQDMSRHGGLTMEQVYRDYFATTYPEQKDEMYSRGVAIVAGDLVSSLAYELAISSQINPDVKVATIQAFNQLMIETIAGWQTQTEQNYMPIETVSTKEVISGMTLVSALYSMVWPLRLGQVLAGRLTDDQWDKNLETYGVQAGLAFQIMDDVLGMFGDPKETGKPVGHDYREGKKTLLLLTAYAKSTQPEKEFIARTLGTAVTESDIAQVKQIMETTGALEETKKLAADYAKQAKLTLAEISTSHQEEITLLSQLADLLADRTY